MISCTYKYDLAAIFNAFAKRQTLLNGRPICDEDIIEQAIREVMQQ